MKNNKFKLLSILFLAVTLIFNISCNMNLLDSKEDSGTYITISVGATARTITPSVSEVSLINIALYKDSVADENLLAEWDSFEDLENSKIPMEEGECTLILKATLGVVELEDKQTVTINDGPNYIDFELYTTEKAISAEAAEGDTGSVKIILWCDIGDEEVSDGIMQLTNANGDIYKGSLVPSDGDLIFKAKDIPAGYYFFTVQAAVGEKYAVYRGTVLVAKNMTSEETIICSLSNIALISSVNVTIQDKNDSSYSLETVLCAGARFDKIFTSIFEGELPSRDGYLFSGFENEDGEEVSFVPGEDCTVYIRWLEEKTVSFVTGEGSPVDSIKVPYSRYIAVIEPSWIPDVFYATYDFGLNTQIEKPVREGYLFDGWYFDSACSDDKKASCNDWSNYFEITDDITLYAKWAEGVVVNFDTDGGTEIEPVTLEKNSQIKIACSTDNSVYTIYKVLDSGSLVWIKDIEVPVKEGSILEGFYLDSGFETVVKFGSVLTLNYDEITLYAKWNTGCTLSFYEEETDSEPYFSVNVPSGADIRVKYDLILNGRKWIVSNENNGIIYSTFMSPEKDVYGAMYWYYKTETENKQFYSATISEDTSLYVKWGVICNVAFVLNGGTSTNNTSFTEIEGTGVYLPAFTPVREGYTFAGWYLDEELTEAVTDSIYTINSDVVFYAKWSNVFIRFDTDGGTEMDPVVLADVNNISFSTEVDDNFEKVVCIKNGYDIYKRKFPTKEGYVLTGWKEPVQDTDGNYIITAVWSEAAPLNIYNGNTLYKTIILPKDVEMAYDYESMNSGISLSCWYFATNDENCSFYEYLFPPENEDEIPEGLYSDAEFTTPFAIYPSTFKVTEAGMDAYIKWTTPYTVKVNVEDEYSSIDVPAYDSYKCEVIFSDDIGSLSFRLLNSKSTKGYVIEMNTVTAPEGQIFSGLCSDSACKNLINYSSVDIQEDTDFYVRFADSCSIAEEDSDTDCCNVALGNSIFFYEDTVYSNCYCVYENEIGGIRGRISRPHNEENEDEVFQGWYFDEEFTKPVPMGSIDSTTGLPVCDSSYTVTDNITLYAKWSE